MIAHLGSNIGRHLALGASVAMHAMVAVAAVGGHGLPGPGIPGRDPDPVIAVELESAIPTSLPLQNTAGEGTTEALSQRSPTHRHSYPVPPGHDDHPHDPAFVHVVSAPDAHDSSEVVSDAPQPEVPAHFVLSAGGSSRSLGPGEQVAGAGAGDGPARVEETVAESNVSAPARVVRSAPVVYPTEARAEEIETDVRLEIVVNTHGNVVEARPISHRGYGLEEAALQAIRAYRFSPAERRGSPIRVRMGWTVLFRLR